MLQLRKYQQEAHDRVIDDLKYYDRVLVMAATGTGKTIMFLSMIDTLLAEGGRGLVIAHMDHLVQQPIEKIDQFFPQLAISVGIVNGDQKDYSNRLTVGSVQTLRKKEVAEQLGHIDYIVIDEAHHATADTYLEMLGHFPGAKVIGFTATPLRTDRLSLREVFAHVSFKFPINKAIQAGALCPFSAFGYHVDVDIPEDWEEGQNEEMGDLLSAENVMSLIFDKWQEIAGNRQTMAFAASVAMSRRLAAYFQSRGIRAIAVDGSMRNKHEIQEQFKSGEWQVIWNMKLLTEGFDAPETSALIMAAPTKSDLVYTQRLGRGLRIAPGKEDTLVLDFAPIGGRNIVMAGDILGGVPKRATDTMQKAEDAGIMLSGISVDSFGSVGFIDPDNIIKQVIDLLARNKLAWSFDGKFAVAAIAESHMICIVAPDRERIEKAHEARRERNGFTAYQTAVLDWISSYRLYEVRKDEKWASTLTATGTTFSQVKAQAEMIYADDIDPGLAYKSKGWRKNGPSDKQIAFASRLGVYRPGMSRGEVSLAISTKLAVNTVARQDLVEQGRLKK